MRSKKQREQQAKDEATTTSIVEKLDSLQGVFKQLAARGPITPYRRNTISVSGATITYHFQSSSGTDEQFSRMDQKLREIVLDNPTVDLYRIAPSLGIVIIDFQKAAPPLSSSEDIEIGEI
jgi:hypothetical protein